MNKDKVVLITGSCGFIGMHTCELFLKKNYTVVGIDNLNDYYNPLLKKKRLAVLRKYENFIFHKTDITKFNSLNTKVKKYSPKTIIHLAAQAGVRYSLINPWEYINVNLLGTTNIFESARLNKVSTVLYASSSSVYGNSQAAKFKESDNTDHPVSLYAATKKSGELIAHSYHKLYKINAVGLRFFTVYGPYDRPDMALFMFSSKILRDEPIDVFSGGELERDFTYIDDIVQGIWGAYKIKKAGYRIYNLGGNKTHSVNQFISFIEKSLNKKAIRNELPFQKGDVPKTSANISKSKKDLMYEPKTKLREGIEKRNAWFIKNWSWLQKI